MSRYRSVPHCRTSRASIVKLITGFVLISGASGAPISAQVPTHATQVRRFASVAMSPDGRNVAWIGPSGAGTIAEVQIGADGGKSAPVAAVLPGAASGTASEITWSPDSRTLAVIALEPNGTPALYLVPADARGATRLAVIPGSVHEPQFSPDGSQIALLYSSPSEEANGPTAATPRDTGVMDAHIDRQHLSLVDARSGGFRTLSKPDVYVYEYAWRPDSREIVVSAANGSGNNNWWVARLDAIDVSNGTERRIAKPRVQIAQPSWSPDGKNIAFIGGLMSDQGSTGGDLYLVPATGGVARDLTPNIDESFGAFQWSGPNSMLATLWSHGGSKIARVDARTGSTSTTWSGDETISSGSGWGPPTVSASRDGSAIAVVRESLSNAPEIWAGAPGKWIQITHVNSGVAPAWGKSASVHWRSDRFNVQGYLIYPGDFDPARKYPLVVYVHGGPSSASASTFLSAASQQAALSRAGYFVFMPNPRGSYGQGEAFTRANVKDFGYGDLRDIMAGVDTVLRHYPVDARRLGISGWSYGGFMTMWAVTQTRRFKAAVAGAGISNWLSYTGENGISEWMVPFFGATAYENKSVYARSSPINFISSARTPTLIVVGERDAECPSPQSFEFWRGLQHENVGTQLVVYPDEGHHFSDPAHQRDVLERSVAWFDRYLK